MKIWDISFDDELILVLLPHGYCIKITMHRTNKADRALNPMMRYIHCLESITKCHYSYCIIFRVKWNGPRRKSHWKRNVTFDEIFVNHCTICCHNAVIDVKFAKITPFPFHCKRRKRFALGSSCHEWAGHPVQEDYIYPGTTSSRNGPLARYVKLRVAHAPGTFPYHRGLAIPACITARAWPLCDKNGLPVR